MPYQTLSYETDGRIVTITLNRPERLNAIVDPMPQEIAAAVARAEADDGVHAIVVQGAGKGFCGGYDLVAYAEADGEINGSQEMPWDPTVDFNFMWKNTQDFMKLWRATKPTIAKVHGAAVAGGSDIALCCDFLIMTEDARIGYPPARVWGVPTPSMWVYRLGMQQAKYMMMTGSLLTGLEAKSMGLAFDAVPEDQLDDAVNKLAGRLTGVPRNQLMMTKMVVNQAYEHMGINHTQMFATMFDGVSRHSPEGMWFRERAQEVGFKQAVFERDSGQPIAPGVSKPNHTR
ncbi:crotonase/enoyl-CoA hydratase family protein [Pseudovibrio sp. Tun.PSC04-5.I4]|uniref:crotonase/enoyl-CoA hydratase family protein n=1 Tax=Pseudovibrio sp. Tun.PSC04-5.I4 TaxID=1798213 RepID=UPI00087F2197|nr:crotonase/enoyl-CoA hydratase family protein [Pseudovibrio sp. Tun.PSC04-5.I4]SDR48027.1 enoyl-CoA hydratase [Pseudovibrio sp. Tun.PSC04-5.I4]